MKRTIEFVLCVALGFFLAALWGQAAHANTPELDEVRLTQKLRDHMRDPDSLRLLSVSLFRNAAGDPVLCGEYTARNGYGGVNRSYFVVHAGLKVEQVMTGRMAAMVWEKACIGRDLLR